MSTLDLFESYFKPDAVPDPLAKLIAFDKTQNGWFSQGFELNCDLDPMFESYSDIPDFLNALFGFAQADCTCSVYALWRQSGDLNNAPVVAFGSEGGAHVVAENLPALLRILTLDAEPMISWDEIYYFKSPDTDPSDGAADYAKWLATTFKLTPVKDAAEVTQLIKTAQKLHDKSFKTWFKQFQP